MFLVTGANGALFGRPVLDQLRRLVPDAGIVAGTRDPGSARLLPPAPLSHGCPTRGWFR